jgi:tetratricopeptide (TPR) repeat protein
MSESSPELAAFDPETPSKYDRGLVSDDERIRQNPSDAVAYLNRGIWHHWHGEFEKALADYDRAIEIDPGVAYAYCSRASLRATCPDASFRDARQALDDARRALKLAGDGGELIGDWRHRLYIQVLAAAHAENDEFDAAVALQSKALDLAVTMTPRANIMAILDRYRANKAFREQSGLVRFGFTKGK